jgi:hypothetical protein
MCAGDCELWWKGEGDVSVGVLALALVLVSRRGGVTVWMIRWSSPSTNRLR